MLGGEGADQFWGEEGNDKFYIDNSGDVIVDGGSGFDRAIVNAATGIDIAVGSWVNVERIDGYTGNDRISALGNTTGITLAGGSGADWLEGGSGNDLFYGGSGDDWIFGGAGNDALIASDGSDHLNGGTGNDFLLGGAGADVFVFENNFGEDVVKDFVPSEDRLNLIGIPWASSFADLQIVQDGSHVMISSSSGSPDIVTLADTLALTITSDCFLFT